MTAINRRIAPQTVRFSLCAALVFAARAFAQNPAPAPAYPDIRHALAALKAAKTDDERRRVYQAIPQVPIADHDDMTALYEEARSRQRWAPVLASSAAFDAYIRDAQVLNERLSTATDSKLDGDVAALIEREAADLPSSTLPILPVGHMTLGVGARSLLRVQRLHALMDAAGAGKNDKARAALWKMVDAVHDAYFGQLAVVELGRIGNPADLDKLIAMVQADPRLRFEFTSFGPAALPKIVDAIRRSPMPPPEFGALAMGIVETSNHDSLPQLVPLMHDPNKLIAAKAIQAVGQHLQTTDMALITSMLNDPASNVRAGVFDYLGGRLPWDENLFGPILIRMWESRSSEDWDVAGNILGRQKARSALPAFEKSLNDPDPRVRRVAAEEIKAITGQAP